MKRYTLLLFVFLFALPFGPAIFLFGSTAEASRSQTDSREAFIEMIIENEKVRVLELADRLLVENPVTVTANTCERSSGGIHDYYSEGDYWWPDPVNPQGAYIRKDGLSNPENFKLHRRAVGQFSWIVGTQTSAYLLTGDKKYSDAAMKHLLAWFVDSTTMMNPHLLYAQAISGVCSGRGIGIIDATSFIEVAQSVGILEKSPYVSAEEIFKIKAWFKEFLHWFTTHPYGIEEMNWENNHGTWWHAQAAAYAKLTGNADIMDLCRDHYKNILLPDQMSLNGSFPLEIERTKPFGYSLFNMEGMGALAWILSDSFYDIWNYSLSDGRGIMKGVEFILPYIKDKNAWPFPKDISNWDDQPRRCQFLLFAGLSQNNPEYFNVWKKIDDQYPNDESRRNSPIKNPILWLDSPDPLAGKTYTNPIIPGFNPDPSICRVGEDYYLVTSTFEYFPGVPVYRSKDLVNWEMIGHVLNRPSQLNLDSINCSGGIYAPTIRYYKDTFYMITTLVGSSNGHRNFIATAKNPAGPWSEPHWIADAPGIDPSLFFDDNGKVYYSGNISPKTRLWDKHRNIYVQEIDLKKWKLKGERVEVLDGADYYKKGTLDGGIENGVNNYEASHIYKKNGKYFLVISHGGTSQNHAVSIWKSDNVFGPYEVNPANPILTHRDLSPVHPFTSTGHADFVETQKGEWWMVYLAKRPYGGENHIMGRETFMSPVDWSGTWPVVNPQANTGRGEVLHFRPELNEFKFNTKGPKDEFDSMILQKQWTFIRTPRTEWWSLSERKGYLRLQLRPEMISQKVNPSFIGKRQEHINFSASVKMEFKPTMENEEAGLVVERDKDYLLKLTCGIENGQKSLRLVSRNGEQQEETLLAFTAIDSDLLFLKIVTKGILYNFSYSTNGDDWTILKENVDGRLLGLAGAGRFTGTFIGMYASSNGAVSDTHVDFDYFEYQPLD